MKGTRTGRRHVVPLSRQALHLLEDQAADDGSVQATTSSSPARASTCRKIPLPISLNASARDRRPTGSAPPLAVGQTIRARITGSRKCAWLTQSRMRWKLLTTGLRSFSTAGANSYSDGPISLYKRCRPCLRLAVVHSPAPLPLGYIVPRRNLCAPGSTMGVVVLSWPPRAYHRPVSFRPIGAHTRLAVGEAVGVAGGAVPPGGQPGDGDHDDRYLEAWAEAEGQRLWEKVPYDNPFGTKEEMLRQIALGEDKQAQRHLAVQPIARRAVSLCAETARLLRGAGSPPTHVGVECAESGYSPRRQGRRPQSGEGHSPLGGRRRPVRCTGAHGHPTTPGTRARTRSQGPQEAQDDRCGT